jgi:hypothetical protein
MIAVNKRLAIYSQNGAANTIIDSSSFPVHHSHTVVYIQADGVRFGREGGGFTIVGGHLTNELSVNAGDVSVVGNVAHNVDSTPNNSNNQGIGFYLRATHGQVAGSGNVAIGNQLAGFFADSYLGQGIVILDSNSAFENPGAGFLTYGDARHVITNNQSIGNGFGFKAFQGPATFLRNTAIGNTYGGILVIVGSGTFFENSVIGNVDVGFNIFPGTSGVVLRRNNIFGNGRTNIFGTAGDNCGVQNQSSQVVDARENYWGAPSGPGGDPADNAGPGCDTGGGLTVTKHFATNKLPIN